jgi:hypothetical protein
MPVEEYLTASGRRVHGGEAGVVYSETGTILFHRAPVKGIDENLFAVLKIAVDQMGLYLVISSIDTGHHVPGSRHYDGRAADISRVGSSSRTVKSAGLSNPFASRLATYLQRHGFRVGEGGPWPGLLWGPVQSPLNPTSIPHDTHLHCSLPRRPGEGAGGPGEVEPLEDL